MNPSTALATVLVDELVRAGVADAVVAPGSRSAPLALALHAADAAGRLRLHVRIDERSAGFLALGLAKASGRPVPVACTSGTATANLHPAVLEAAHAGVPLLLLTADRPPELRGSGANQTVDQIGLYGTGVRWFHEVGAPDVRPGQNAYWRTLVDRAVAIAVDPTHPGPVHLNLALREPLLPDDGTDWPESLHGRPAGAVWTAVERPAPAAAAGRVDGRRGLVVAAQPHAGARSFAEHLSWPLLVETGGAGSGGPNLLTAGPWLLGDADFLAAHRPDVVLVVGRPTLFRSVSRLLADSAVRVELVSSDPWPAPGNDVAAVHRNVPPAADRAAEGWLRAWLSADRVATAALDKELAAASAPTGLSTAHALIAALPDRALLVLGSSQSIRDVGLAAPPRPDLRLLANRGVAGIDGTVSTAIGAALGYTGPAYALMGDLTFLHDANGLVLGPDEPRPDLTIVVVNNDGGAIFALLEPGESRHAGAFERVFGTPHGVDLAALCSATHTSYHRASTVDEMAAALGPAAGIRVVELAVDRSGVRAQHESVRAAIAAVLP